MLIPGQRMTAVRAVAVLVCAALMTLAGCYSGSASQQARAAVTAAPQASAATWHAQNSDTRHRLYDVACLSALRCEAVGTAGTIVATANGGRTWRAQANPLRGSATSLYQITCVAPSSCYVIGRPGTILVTHNAGASWSRHVLPVGVPATDLTDQACLSANLPALAGRYALCRLGLVGIACASARVCYAVSITPLAYSSNPVPRHPATPPSSVWMTRNGGTSWTRQAVPSGVACNGDCDPSLGYPYPLEWVTCLSSGLCRAGGGQFLGCGHCGFARAVLLTRGPGRPWTCVTHAPTCAEAPDAAVCPTSSICYGIDSTNPFSAPDISVDRSSDGGANWQQVGPDWSASVLNAVACLGTQTCYLAGTHGSIARITGGTTLAAQRTPVTRDLYGIACPSPCACYAVGDDGTILKD